MIAGLVSTIIPVYNRGDMLRQAAASVLAQSYRQIEIIVVDDGSTDDTPAVADELARAHPGALRVLHRENGGPGPAREAGRQVARGEFIQYLDSDDLLLPRKFEIQTKALRKNPEYGAAYGMTRLIGPAGDVLAAPYKWTGRRFDQLFPALLVDRWWNTHTPLWRRSACDVIGPWSGMRMSEDWEYEARAGAVGIRLAYCPVYLSDTRRHDGTRLAGGPLTGEKIGDIARLIVTLHGAAVQAGVTPDQPEMRHFSRWAFLVARQAGAAGLAEAAEGCFAVARSAAGEPGRSALDFRAYGLLAACVGWCAAGGMACLADRLFKRRPGQDTLRQSWMEGAGGKP